MKKKESWKEICGKMAVMMAIKEQSIIQGKDGKPVKKIRLAISKNGNDRINYFFNHLYRRTKSIKELEKEFGTKRLPKTK